MLTLAACAVHLALTVIVILRGARSPMALPLAALCVDFFAFNAADLAGHASPALGWKWLDSAAASMLTPLALHLFLAFVGRRREFWWVSLASYVVFGTIAAACALAFLPIPWAREFSGSAMWAVMVLVCAVPFVATLAWLTLVHWRRNRDLRERTRTRVVIAAYVILTLVGPTDLLADMGLAVPRLANVGTLTVTLLLGFIALRFDLFDRKVPALFAVNAVVAGVLTLFGYVVVFRYLASSHAMLVLGTLTATLALLPTLRDLATAQTIQRERVQSLATLGRFSAQMAHDLQNPLAAAKGAAQLLLRERGDRALSPDQADYVRLIVEQTERIARVVTDYRRLGRLEAGLAPGDLGAVASEVATAQSIAAPPGVTVRYEGEAAVPCHFDRDLIARALENLVRNAFEAMPEGGAVTLRAGRDDPFVTVSVEDAGSGMSPRVVERALEDFFTTKASGSGLGLALVRRVAEAHGGRVAIDSAEGRGTTVTLRLRADAG